MIQIVRSSLEYVTKVYQFNKLRYLHQNDNTITMIGLVSQNNAPSFKPGHHQRSSHVHLFVPMYCPAYPNATCLLLAAFILNLGEFCCYITTLRLKLCASAVYGYIFVLNRVGSTFSFDPKFVGSMFNIFL